MLTLPHVFYRAPVPVHRLRLWKWEGILFPSVKSRTWEFEGCVWGEGAGVGENKRPGSWPAEDRSVESPLLGINILPPHTPLPFPNPPRSLSPFPPFPLNSCEQKTNLEILVTPLVPKRQKGRDSVKPLREAKPVGWLYPWHSSFLCLYLKIYIIYCNTVWNTMNQRATVVEYCPQTVLSWAPRFSGSGFVHPISLYGSWNTTSEEPRRLLSEASLPSPCMPHSRTRPHYSLRKESWAPARACRAFLPPPWEWIHIS